MQDGDRFRISRHAVAVDGKYGKQVEVLIQKPFAQLRINDLREKLHARGVHDTNKLKPQLQRGPSGGLERTPTCTNLATLQSHPIIRAAKRGGIHYP